MLNSLIIIHSKVPFWSTWRQEKCRLRFTDLYKMQFSYIYFLLTMATKVLVKSNQLWFISAKIGSKTIVKFKLHKNTTTFRYRCLFSRFSSYIIKIYNKDVNLKTKSNFWICEDNKSFCHFLKKNQRNFVYSYIIVWSEKNKSATLV